MRPMRTLTLVAGLTTAAIGLAAPASAELTDGTYVHTTGTDSTYQVVITSCGAGCKHAEYPGTSIPPRDFFLSGNTWTPPMPDDGIVETIDNNTLDCTLTAPMGGSSMVLRSRMIKTG